MEFIPDDPNPKWVRIAATTEEERAWFATLRGTSRRCRKGSEHYVKRAFKAWLREYRHPSIDAAALATAMMGGSDTKSEGPVMSRPSEKNISKGHSLIQEVREWASRLIYDADYREGLCGKDQIGPLTSLACQAAQLLGIANPPLTGVPWTEKAEAILDWAEQA